MATAAGIILVAGALSLTNEALDAQYVQGKTNVLGSINWRVIPATAVAAIMFAGLEQINATFAKGLAGIVVVTTLLHPFGTDTSLVTKLSEMMGMKAVTAQAATSGRTNPGSATLPVQTGPIAV